MCKWEWKLWNNRTKGIKLSRDHVSPCSCAEHARWTRQPEYLSTVDFCLLVCNIWKWAINREHTVVSTLYQWNCLPPIGHHKRSPPNLKSINIMKGHLPDFNFLGLTVCVPYTMATLPHVLLGSPNWLKYNIMQPKVYIGQGSVVCGVCVAARDNGRCKHVIQKVHTRI